MIQRDMFRPRAVYRGLGYTIIGVVVVYAFITIISGDDERIHKPSKTHLYITVSKDRIESRLPKLAPKRILFWTTIFGTPAQGTVADCPGLSDRCIFDYSRELLPKADAVLFHMSDVDPNDIPSDSQRLTNQKYVFMTQETPLSTRSKFDKLPKRFFNWTMTYLLSSDVLFKYGGFWIDRKTAELRGFPKADGIGISESAIASRKPGVFWLVSNCHTPSGREKAVDALSKFYPVHISGACSKSQAIKDLCPKGRNCDEVIGSYMFHIIAENTICEDYVTEKYWDRWKLPSVPIAMRRRPYASLSLPPKSVIFMEDFNGPKEMADYLISLQDNKTAYAEYFDWRNNGDWMQAPWNAPGYRNGYCKLCERLWENAEESTIENVGSWFDGESKCDADEFAKEWTKAIS